MRGVEVGEHRITAQRGWTDEHDWMPPKGDAKPSRELRIDQVRAAIDWSQQTSGRGRAAIVHLTEAGRSFERGLKQAARKREARLVAPLAADERTQAAGLLRKLIDGVAGMNKD